MRKRTPASVSFVPPWCIRYRHSSYTRNETGRRLRRAPRHLVTLSPGHLAGTRDPSIVNIPIPMITHTVSASSASCR